MEYGNIISLNDDENYDDLSEFAVSQNTLAEDIEDMYSDYGYTSGPGATPPYSSMSASPASSPSTNSKLIASEPELVTGHPYTPAHALNKSCKRVKSRC
ncbi:hypothetical protein CYLTODRAFT_458042 [Cylindrobasidium torrendii FP15055 ss-10]|uniref:Uncharacterized protein n=1 Tax=Cylindrobasidium torrendii FP15055 ss-10 TaxID=1314674 RepID=A0A0D7B025_9AGAR|nr:hypothetical protein CYLTODRAFT_458844 [Cylindrobasidium torrendii FP15055 ss-10]KIY63499.1 hypothetical protein CYLTODRAFT_458042 [Cylindrobasidium torrendii FP15055 ss-10]